MLNEDENCEVKDEAKTKTEILQAVSNVVRLIAKPEKIQFVPELPKTRNGKIMRRILRKIAVGERENFGDISTLLNPEIVEAVKDGAL